MLKVLKNEWRDDFNYVKPTLIAGILVSLAVGVLLNLVDGPDVGWLEWGFTIGMFVWFGIMTALFVMTIVRIVESQTKRMYGPEGYYPHMLPISAKELVGGKCLGIWIFGVFMVAYACLSCVLVGGVATLCSGEMGEVLRFMAESVSRFTLWHYGVIMQAILVFLALSACWVLAFQFIFEAAHQFGKYGFLGGLITFWVVNALIFRLGRVSMILAYLVVAAGSFFGTVCLEEKRLNVG